MVGGALEWEYTGLGTGRGHSLVFSLEPGEWKLGETLKRDRMAVVVGKAVSVCCLSSGEPLKVWGFSFPVFFLFIVVKQRT